ncbi:GrpB family protein [Henriciella litoralis]|uniref:GrpB family protein n=1 Tax=Henriciella litoralis TaxID=568102 RepID=UPI000A01AE6C|nr:GrpB family protein [Henriciella litoralis]
MDEIEIAPYDPDWPAAFERERSRLAAALSDVAILDLVHFGSTAIADMPAKPIIDMLMIVPDLATARDVLPERLNPLGYDFWADNPKTDRLFFVRGMPPRGVKRTHHLHVCEPDSELHQRLAFQDYLNAHPGEAAAYADLKKDLAVRHRIDREAYTRAKQGFIDRIMRLASKT